ncbi:ABC transporter permease [Streptomyces sp. SCSIO ZS0520]|uniref:ABC transporter permease n=1 Tax=Streptomyces sp. SCSIO ZS0520 TaxID=2892996 RepID=UPI0021D8AC05|nr:ABC transporter permease [Streptomyces sp. SCSIO ZS0520]
MSGPAQHFRAELMKTGTGRATLGSLLGGALWCALTGYGYYAQGRDDAAALASGAVTGDIIRGWMMMLLFSAITCALIVTRDVSGGTLARAVLSYGGRGRVFLAKLLAALATSALFAVVAVGGALANWALAARSTETDLVWNAESTKTLLGVAACVLLSGVWGLMTGWLVRNQTLAVLSVLVLMVGIEPAVQRFAPEAAQFLFTIALSSLYRDPKPDLLPVAAAALVSVVWVAALTAAARVSLLRRDIG